ncbi:predicted protein [Fibroporia radiculosa]|uniref:Uncharacterized protein n=1 Tax=Fibroporia radiculosa TaxID=599839 RepID=J7RH52_9APHY|nr:predicted protein [Fibroporia radiculosa]
MIEMKHDVKYIK